jgi:hypothetical protein
VVTEPVKVTSHVLSVDLTQYLFAGVFVRLGWEWNPVSLPSGERYTSPGLVTALRFRF